MFVSDKKKQFPQQQRANECFHKLCEHALSRYTEGNGDREGLVRRRVRYFGRYGAACAVRRLPGRGERAAERVCKAETRS